MKEANVGERVGVILSRKDNDVDFLGYGVYEGDFPAPGITLPDFDTTFPEYARLPEDEQKVMRQAFNKLVNNPRIQLDNGDVVWGIECWWGPEEKVKQSIEGCIIHHVRLKRDDKGVVIETIRM